jgi:hypothetical protein
VLSDRIGLNKLDIAFELLEPACITYPLHTSQANRTTHRWWQRRRLIS